MITKMRFCDTVDVYQSPSASMTIEGAVLWLARLNHCSIRKVEHIGGNTYLCHNRRRGPNRRSCLIEVLP